MRVLLAIALAALTAQAPVVADDATPCVLVAVRSESSYQGVLTGAAAGDLRCDLVVAGTPVATASGYGVVLPRVVTFGPGEVTLCATGAAGTRCESLVAAALQPAYDVLDALFAVMDYMSPDPMLCPVLLSVAGDYGPVAVNGQGDVFVDGEWLWDCPPYDVSGDPPDPTVIVLVAGVTP